jgi:CO/xanthine dehydrogenase FAD-binding subunit
VGLPLERLDEALKLVAEEIDPPGDPMASAGYRRHLATVLAGRAVRDACRRSGGEMG